MLNASSSTSSVKWQVAPVRSSPSSLNGDALLMLTLRYMAHLPYFKAASMLTLPQGLGTGGALVTTLVYALACLAASRWMAGLRRGAAEVPHAAVLPLLGTTAVIITMMVAGPAIATLLPRNPNIAVDTASLLPGYFAMLVPVCAGFFLAQMLTGPRRARRAEQAAA